jgi:hypothetical protein
MTGSAILQRFVHETRAISEDNLTVRSHILIEMPTSLIRDARLLLSQKQSCNCSLSLPTIEETCDNARS